MQIEQNRKGKEVTLDLRIGTLHAYPNGELQFENCDDNAGQLHGGTDDLDQEVQAINQRRKVPRNLRPRKDENDITEKNLEHLARAMSQGAENVQIRSVLNSVATPNTYKSSKSQMSKLTGATRS